MDLPAGPPLDGEVSQGGDPSASLTITWPAVSVVMPVRDEARHLREAVRHVLAQDYPGDIEVVLAVGPSRDATAEVARGLAVEDSRVRPVANASGRTAAGLNAALAAARHEIVARVDGHAILPPDYLRVAVATLEQTGADNVGGLMAAEGRSDFECAVARAMTTKLGVGGARFHTGGSPGPADTVYLGVFRRAALRRVGGYDERFTRAQDWEMNFRIRATGGTVWFTPDMHVTYRPRSSLRALARQYFEYGTWRRAVMRRHPETVSARYLAAPVAVLAVSAGTALGLAGRRIGWLSPTGYLGAIAVGSAVNGRRLPPGARGWLPVVYMTMHGCWGVGFLLSRVDAETEPPPADGDNEDNADSDGSAQA